jgi:hypothetical protein
MDPLSITVSVITLLGVVKGVAKGLAKLKSYREAPNEIIPLINEVRLNQLWKVEAVNTVDVDIQTSMRSYIDISRFPISPCSSKPLRRTQMKQKPTAPRTMTLRS